MATLVADVQGTTLTYQELEQRSNQLACHLQRNGVTAGSCVGILMERSVHLMVAMLATMKAGAAYVPMDPEYPADRLALMAEDSEVRLARSQWQPGLRPCTLSLASHVCTPGSSRAALGAR